MAIPADQFWPILLQTCLMTVLVFGLAAFAAGLGMLLASAATFRFFHRINRWVSLRAAFKQLELPRHATDRFAHRNRYAVGIALIIGGAASLAILLTQIGAFALAPALARGAMVPLLQIAAESLRWFLVVGGAFAVLIGLMLCFADGALRRVEGHANRWVSGRKLSRGADDMHPVLDNLVEANPRSSGLIFAAGGLAAAAYATLLLLHP